MGDGDAVIDQVLFSKENADRRKSTYKYSLSECRISSPSCATRARRLEYARLHDRRLILRLPHDNSTRSLIG
jgi:hypothetical protein